GNQKLEQAKDLRDFANNVDQNVNQQLEAQKPLYDSRASESLLEAGKLDGNASAASTNAEGLGSLAQAAQAMGKGGGGSGGGSASPGVSGYNGLNTGIDKTESFRLASSGGGGTSSASMASPSDFFKKGNGEFTAGFGSGAKSSSPDATTASVANLKEKLQAERAARNAARQADGSAASGGSASTGEGALGPEGNGTLASSVSAGGMPIGSGMGDLGLSIGLGDPKFDDAMKSMLGLGTEEGALSEEERALLASRRLASLDGTLPPEVLAADSATLFERTRDRIKISLQRGNILGGLGAKLK
ncbi:MAG: hypothetical protein HUU37_03575, partial [Bdellovibrionales bacterium]|nr:hypothetical protein [Bdellovibrionales bacterium]